MTPSFPSDRRPGPVQTLLRYWWLGLGLLVLGAVVGLLLGLTRPTNYTAESRLVVGNGDLSSYEVAGFATASEQLASNYARYVDNSSVVSRQLHRDLGSKVNDLVGISASPITDSDVISVEVTGTSRSAATGGAKSIAGTLVRLTRNTNTGSSQSGLLARYEHLSTSSQNAATKVQQLTKSLAAAKKNNSGVAAAQARLDGAKTHENLINLQMTTVGSQYQSAVLTPASESSLSVIQSASIISDDHAKTVEVSTLAGAIIGLFIALVVVNLPSLRRSRRRRDVG